MRLFLYGVLRAGLGDWPFLAGLGPGSPATAAGELYAIPDAGGWYPALVLAQGHAATTVHGTNHAVGTVDLAAIDAFEGLDYARMAVPVDRGKGAAGTSAHAYIWTSRLPDRALAIPHGDFVRWLAETGHAPFRG
jgi:gamma-glutamylcyclotransferase (GGCT)/AIG2-like uncharacterized protein YtfP